MFRHIVWDGILLRLFSRETEKKQQGLIMAHQAGLAISGSLAKRNSLRHSKFGYLLLPV